jgi:chemotaxis protein MotA
LKDIARGIMGVFGSSAYSTKRYVVLLTMIFEPLKKAHREGLVALEGDVEDPQESALVSKYASFLKDHHAVNFSATPCGWRSAAGLRHSTLIKCWGRGPRHSPS